MSDVNRTQPSNQIQTSSRPGGFSALEVLIVVLILGILVAAGAPQIRRSIEKRELRQAVTQFISDLQFAATTARATNQPVTVLFRDYLANSANEYEIVDQTHPLNNRDFIVVLGDSSSQFEFVSSSDQLVFDIYGYPSQDTHWNFNNASGSISLSINAQTGEFSRQ